MYTVELLIKQKTMHLHNLHENNYHKVYNKLEE